MTTRRKRILRRTWLLLVLFVMVGAVPPAINWGVDENYQGPLMRIVIILSFILGCWWNHKYPNEDRRCFFH